MSFEHNEQFREYFDRVMEREPFHEAYQPQRRIRTSIKGMHAKIWRWFHGRMLSTSRQFGTVTHKGMADSIEDKGWIIRVIPAKSHVSKDYLFYEVAQGIQKAIPQLSHQTQIASTYKYPHRIQCVQSSPMEVWDAAQPMSPIVPAAAMNTYEIEWQQFAVQVASDKFYGDMDYYQFAVAYDALNDCLYLDYFK